MPDEHDHRPEPEPSTPSAEAASAAATIGFSVRPGRAPLITAIEIENFKGIGNPVRIDVRPITLLFGRNSAGKSTLLHALCYAGEILGHRSGRRAQDRAGRRSDRPWGIPQLRPRP